MNYIGNAGYRVMKSNLTRAVNKAKKATERQDRLAALRAIVRLVDKTYEEWSVGGYAWPDDWSRWERAKEDALYEIRREIW